MKWRFRREWRNDYLDWWWIASKGNRRIQGPGTLAEIIDAAMKADSGGCE
jgi:hypothetical protein